MGYGVPSPTNWCAIGEDIPVTYTIGINDYGSTACQLVRCFKSKFQFRKFSEQRSNVLPELLHISINQVLKLKGMMEELILTQYRAKKRAIMLECG